MKDGGPTQNLSNPSTLSQNPAHTRPASSAPLAPAPVAPVPSPRPVQQVPDDVMEVDADTIAANNAAYNANPMDDADLNPGPRSNSRNGNGPPRAPRETYRPPPHDERPLYYDDHARNHRGGYGFQDQQQYPRQGGAGGGGGYGGGGYRDDRRGRFRNEGTMYSDSMMGRGNGRYRR